MNKQNDFDIIYNRVGTECIKWDDLPREVSQGQLNAMWIADMEFATPTCIINAMMQRLQHPIFGYISNSKRFYDAIAHWHRTRYQIVGVTEDVVSYQNSVLGGVTTAIYTFTQEKESVLIHAPAYGGFIRALQATNRNIVLSELKQDGDGTFIMDFEDMKEKVVDNNIRCLILCSPHNPTGRVWTREELESLAMFCEEHQINIISDEIWADFTFRGHSHIPLQSVNAYMKQHTIACYAPTKTFNLGGLQVAYSIIYNNSLMEAYRKISEQSHYNLLNALSLEALVAGYQEGADWVDDLCHYVEENVDYAYTYIREKLPEIKVIKPQGTYLLWLNLKSYGADFVHILELLASKGLVPDDGRKYGVDNFIRLNLACPREMVKLAMKQLEESLR